jgi:hypothetical protein
MKEAEPPPSDAATELPVIRVVRSSAFDASTYKPPPSFNASLFIIALSKVLSVESSSKATPPPRKDAALPLTVEDIRRMVAFPEANIPPPDVTAHISKPSPLVSPSLLKVIDAPLATTTPVGPLVPLKGSTSPIFRISKADSVSKTTDSSVIARSPTTNLHSELIPYWPGKPGE